MNAFAEVKFADGRRFRGDLSIPLINGCGELNYQNGDIYVGELVNSIPHGKGVFTTAAETRSGTFVNGKLCGDGTLETTNGLIYEGGFLDDKYEGLGELCQELIQIYQGEWHNGLYHG